MPVVVNNTKTIHGYGVGKKSIHLKPGPNEIDGELWTAAKAAHAELRSLIHDKKVIEPKAKKAADEPAPAKSGVSVDIKTK